ncbi:MAG: hypothetical protein KJO77_04750 [Bacteroidia bacterium]|nr:hypothetical protein [Bacteroidia bacterium]
MKNMILFITLITMPFLSFSQNDTDVAQLIPRNEIVSVVEFDMPDSQLVFELNEDIIAYRKWEPIAIDPMDQNKNINFNKSNALISIKAYIKSLQMKRKITLMS